MKKTHFNIVRGENNSPKNNLPAWAGVTDNKDLSKTTSDTPYRYLLAFFMPEICPATQTGHNDSITHLTQFTGLNHHILNTLKLEPMTSYDGVTLQNSPLWVICRADTSSSESEPHHPFNLSKLDIKSVVLTQNLLGGHNHA